MADTIESRLEKLGVSLPTPAAPVANYVAFQISGSLLLTSGQLPLNDGKVAVTGLLGR
ncbi:RidA family protein, partial [Salmonella enterica subsp. enterica]|nr:RidA family protein [Salmonella enterica subsp. enterica serovar Enteritidis]